MGVTRLPVRFAPIAALPIGTSGRAFRPPSSRSYDAPVARTDTASRIVAASPERVFAALTDQQALAVWLPPGDMTGRFERFDPRPGGSYRLILTFADASGAPGKTTGDTDVVEGRF